MIKPEYLRVMIDFTQFLHIGFPRVTKSFKDLIWAFYYSISFSYFLFISPQYDESLHGGGYMEGGAMYHEHRLTHPHLPPVHYPPPAAPAHALPGEPLVHKRDKDAIYGWVVT